MSRARQEVAPDSLPNAGRGRPVGGLPLASCVAGWENGIEKLRRDLTGVVTGEMGFRGQVARQHFPEASEPEPISALDVRCHYCIRQGVFIACKPFRFF
jgi:hypothetical protein